MPGKRPFLVKMVISLSLLLVALIASLRPGAGPYARLVFFAMLFSFVGDFVLGSPALRRSWGNPLPLGMLAFGVGHIFYIIGFGSQVGLGLINWGLIGMLALLAVWVLTFGISRTRELPGGIRIPALIYSGIIGLMAVFSAGAAGKLGGAFWLAPLGALLFVISDSLILEGQVSGKQDTSQHGALIWGTYVPAQALLIFVAFFARA